jgi:hypothetical protein
MLIISEIIPGLNLGNRGEIIRPGKLTSPDLRASNN